MAETSATGVTPRGTSWMSVIGGWIASVGMAALVAPLAAGAVASRGGTSDDLALAVPGILVVAVAYLVGGYVAGRMAGYKTSWHGMMTAFFGLFLMLALILAAYAASQGYLGNVRLDAMPTWAPGAGVIGDALTFGAILGFLAAIFAGWVGGLLAPSRPLPARAAAPWVERPLRDGDEEHGRTREGAPRRTGFRLLPGVRRDRVDRPGPDERVTRDERDERVTREEGAERVTRDERDQRVATEADREVREPRVDRP